MITTACDEVRRTCEAIESIIGEPVEYIRPPYGAYNEKLECMINLNKVLWSNRPAGLEYNQTWMPVVSHVVKKCEGWRHHPAS